MSVTSERAEAGWDSLVRQRDEGIALSPSGLAPPGQKWMQLEPPVCLSVAWAQERLVPRDISALRWAGLGTGRLPPPPLSLPQHHFSGASGPGQAGVRARPPFSMSSHLPSQACWLPTALHPLCYCSRLQTGAGRGQGSGEARTTSLLSILTPPSGGTWAARRAGYGLPSPVGKGREATPFAGYWQCHCCRSVMLNPGGASGAPIPGHRC